jgi:hypothetical protein
MFNPFDDPVVETLECSQPINSAARLDLEGNVVETLRVSGGRVRAALGPKQILTLRLA